MFLQIGFKLLFFGFMTHVCFAGFPPQDNPKLPEKQAPQSFLSRQEFTSLLKNFKGFESFKAWEKTHSDLLNAPYFETFQRIAKDNLLKSHTDTIILLLRLSPICCTFLDTSYSVSGTVSHFGDVLRKSEVFYGRAFGNFFRALGSTEKPEIHKILLDLYSPSILEKKILQNPHKKHYFLRQSFILLYEAFSENNGGKETPFDIYQDLLTHIKLRSRKPEFLRGINPKDKFYTTLAIEEVWKIAARPKNHQNFSGAPSRQKLYASSPIKSFSQTQKKQIREVKDIFTRSGLYYKSIDSVSKSFTPKEKKLISDIFPHIPKLLFLDIEKEVKDFLKRCNPDHLETYQIIGYFNRLLDTQILSCRLDYGSTVLYKHYSTH